MRQVIDALEAERADLQEHLAWLDRQIEEFRERHGDERALPPRRSRRRANARRASTRRATARQRKGDITGSIIDYLKDHPQSTAGDVAKALDANRSTIASRLSQMVKEGEITKASKGYAVK
jgi:Fic family protein